MSDDPAPTDIAAEFFEEEAPIEPNGDLADGFLKDVLGDEPEPEPEKPEGEEEGEPEKPEGEEEDVPEKPESEEEDVPEEPPKGSSKKASEDWKKLRASRDRYKEEVTNAVKAKEAEVVELQTKVTELEELRGKAAISAELEEKLKDYDELEKEVAILNVSRSPEYRKAVSEPLDAVEKTLQILAKKNDANLDGLILAVNEPDTEKQWELIDYETAGWSDLDRQRFDRLVENVRPIFAKQQEMRENASVAAKQREEMSAAEAEKAAAESKKAFLSASESVVGQLKDRVPFVPLRDGETVEDRFAALSEKLKGVDFDANSPNDKAFAAASALVLPAAVKTITKLQGEVKALEERLAKTNSAKPGKSDPVDDGGGEEEEDFFKAMGVPNLDASQRLNVKF